MLIASPGQVPTRRSARRFAAWSAPLAAVLGFSGWVRADAETEARYPYDPACAWGRIANGKGMLHRCLTEKEARAVAEGDPGQLKARGTLPAEATPPLDRTPATEPAGNFVLVVGPITAEEGQLALGGLSKPVDRYTACVADNGGLQKPSGKVVVQFLVRAERARAEGTEVESVTGVSRAAAQCLADVVDRRATGTPTVPMTGASLTFAINPKK
jgi:hypothetical protein